MLSTAQVQRVRQIVEAQEQILRKLKALLQRDDAPRTGFVDLRVTRIEKELDEMEKTILYMTRILQDALMTEHMAKHGA